LLIAGLDLGLGLDGLVSFNISDYLNLNVPSCYYFSSSIKSKK